MTRQPCTCPASAPAAASASPILGERVRAARVAAELSLGAAAAFLGITPERLGEIERGVRRPGPILAERLERAIGSAPAAPPPQDLTALVRAPLCPACGGELPPPEPDQAA